MSNNSTQENLRYAARIFINAVLPLVSVIAQETELGRKFQGKNAIVQFRIKDFAGRMQGMHIKIEEGKMSNCLGLVEAADVELYFPTTEHFVAFFQGTTKKLPKIKGFKKPGILLPLFQILLKMAKWLAPDYRPQKEEEKVLIIRLYFYLLATGISTLNKLGHPSVKAWSQPSPNRVYAYALDGYPDIAAHIRVKAGKTQAKRGPYTSSQPFFTMRFADTDSALAVLQQSGDMLELTMTEKLIMEGAPEFGGQIGELMVLVGSYAQA